MTVLMVILISKSYDPDDNTHDNNDHKKSYNIIHIGNMYKLIFNTYHKISKQKAVSENKTNVLCNMQLETISFNLGTKHIQLKCDQR